IIEPFFDRYPELQALYEAYVFFGQLATSVNYTHGQNTLEKPIRRAGQGRLTYDSGGHLLSYKGVLSTATRNALKDVVGVTVEFQDAVNNLYIENQKAIEDFFAGFFARYPELASQKDAYVRANDSEEQQRSVLLANFLLVLKGRRKRQQALQVISAMAKTDPGFTSAVLDDAVVLHAEANKYRPALDDFMAMEMTKETAGLSAQFYFRDKAEGNPNQSSDVEANLAYSSGANKLPANPMPGKAISGIWRGSIEAPENGS